MRTQRATNIFWHNGSISRQDRERQKGHRGFTLWFTGLSGSGKSTLATATEIALFTRGMHPYVLDGDNVRHGLNKDLGFTMEDRVENIRRIAEVSKLFQDCGIITLTAFISPYRADRLAARQICEAHNFIEIFVDCPLAVCEQRDPKGIYKKARRGEIRHFTGISDPYEEPECPEIRIRSDLEPVESCVDQILCFLDAQGFIPSILPATLAANDINLFFRG